MAIRNIAVLALYNEQKKILLQHRTKNAARLPNYWGFFGGGMHSSENPEQALARELFEELEYRIIAPHFVFSQEFSLEKENETGLKYMFVEKYDTSQKLIQHEGQGLGWWRFPELDNLLIVDHDRLALAKIQELLVDL